MRWDSIKIQLEGEEVLYYISDDKRTHALLAGGDECFCLSYQKINHIIIGMLNNGGRNFSHLRNSKMIEPTYNQKLQVLRDLGKWKKYAMEVMPPDSKLVDVEDVYHIWEFEYLKSFIINLDPIFYGSGIAFNKCFGNIRYDIRSRGDGSKFVYFADRDSVKWSEKQALKNALFNNEATGIEIICNEMVGDYGCMVILPPLITLDFGLLPPKW